MLVVYSLSNAQGKWTDTKPAQVIQAVDTKVNQEIQNVGEAYAQVANSKPLSFGSGSSSHKEWVTLKSSGMISGADGNGFKELAGKNGTATYIPTGSVFRAQLIMPIKTSVQERFVMAQTTHEFRDPSNPALRIPVGTRLIGRAQMNTALRSVDVHFTTMVSPKGKEYPAQILALSKSLFGELNGIFFSNDLETYSSIMAFGFLEGFSQSAKDRQVVIGGLGVAGNVEKDNLSNRVFDGVGSSSFRIAEEMIRDIREKSVEYIVVPSGEEIYAVFTEKFVMPGGKSLE